MKQCDALVACFDPSTLRTEGVQTVAKLWANNISAELAVDSKSLEDLQTKYAKEQHSWIVIIKQESVLKVKSMIRKEQHDTDMHSSQLISYIKAEIRERDQQNRTYERTRPQRHAAQIDSCASNHDQEVRVLMAETKSKKTNRRNVVEQAQEKAASLVHSFLDGPSKFLQSLPLQSQMPIPY